MRDHRHPVSDIDGAATDIHQHPPYERAMDTLFERIAKAEKDIRDLKTAAATGRQS